MKITDTDRALAKELADLMGQDERTEKMLAVVLWSHRQLPADKPSVTFTNSPPPYCGVEAPRIADTITPPRCQRAPGHPPPHESMQPGNIVPTRWDYA